MGRSGQVGLGLGGGELGGRLLHLVDVAGHVEGALGQAVQLSRQDLLEALNGVLANQQQKEIN